MNVFESTAGMGHECVCCFQDARIGYRAIIAVHNTARGPALGGTRLWRYATEAEALTDVLRLAQGMTYKNAIARLPCGGGKSVILANGPLSSEARQRLLEAHAGAIDRLGGLYLAGEDVGTTIADIEAMGRHTRHVAGTTRGAGDPAPWTARGVLRAIEAAVEAHWGSRSLAGRRVALQGCGQVGGALAALLHRAGASITLSDLQAGRAAAAARASGATVVSPEAIFDVEADVFAPCALGGILNDETIPRLRCGVVAGAANNQLLRPEHAEALADRGILYVPDYVANSGGVIRLGIEVAGWSEEDCARRIDGLADTVHEVLARAKAGRLTTAAAADRMAQELLA